jgi:small conductance mechanosensitive channel
MPFEISEAAMTMITAYAVRIIGVAVLLFAAWLLAGWTGRFVRRGCEKAKIDLTLAKFFGNMSRYLVIVLAGLACLGAFGIQTTSFAAVLGAAGLAIGLSLQGSLSNFASGVMLLIFRPFKVGDVVTLAGTTGKIDEIELFTTRMITPDNRLIIVPNNGVFGSTIENVTAFDTRRVDVAVGVDYSADIDQTRTVLNKAAETIEVRLKEPEHAIVLTGLGASSVDWVVRVWAKTDDYWAVKEQLTRAVKVELDAASIGIPFPQMDVHLDQESSAKAS